MMTRGSQSCAWYGSNRGSAPVGSSWRRYKLGIEPRRDRTRVFASYVFAKDASHDLGLRRLQNELYCGRVGRAAIYARFSSDLQRDRSIDDQVALCQEYAARNGYEIVAIFEDRAVTGVSIKLRAGVQKMLQAARTSAFEFVIAESLSRIARDQEDAPAIRRRLGFAGVQLVTPSDGIVTPLMHGPRTIIDSQYLEDLKASIRRGMMGVVRDGRHPGGWTYGYRPVPGKPGEPEIVACSDRARRC